VNSAVVHCTLQGFIARLVVRADKGRRAVWNYRVHDVYNATHDIPILVTAVSFLLLSA